MNITQKLIPSSKYSRKATYKMTPSFFVVHNTANDATASAEIAYMTRNDNATSYHYAIDDTEIIQAIPENRNAWHAGDGEKGLGNRYGIGIEICFSKSGGPRFDKAEELTAKFIAYKLKEKKWSINQVKKHQDFAKKYCPHRTLDQGWERFLAMIQKELNTLNATGAPEDPLWIKILRAKVDSPQAWINFVEKNKDDPTGKWLPNLIEKIGT